MAQTVELKVLVKNLRDVDKAQQTWKGWVDTVSKGNDTLKKTQSTIRSTQQQMQILRTSADKLTKTERERVQGMQLALIALRELEQEQKSLEAAEKQRQAALEQQVKLANQAAAAEEKLRREQEKATKETENNTKAWLRNARTVALWAAGSASVFLIIRKIRRAFTETTRTLFENTKEYERLQKAQDSLKVAFVGVIGGSERWIKLLSDIAAGIEWFVKQLTTATATVRGFGAIIAQGIESWTVAMIRLGEATTAARMGRWIEAVELAKQAWEALPTEIEQANTFLNHYNRSLEESADLQVRFVKASADIDQSKDAYRGLSDEAERYLDFLEKLVDAEQRRVDQTLDLLEELRRREEDIQIERARAFEDLAIESTRKREDIETKFQRRLEDIRDRNADARAKAEDRLRLRLLAIELRYRERLIRIEEDFQDSIGDAIRSRDATAALQAIRRRGRDIGRAERQRDNDRTLAREAFENQIRDQQRALERQRQDAERARQRALEDLRRDQERERQDILLNQQREQEDLRLFFERRMMEIQADYDRQIEAANAFYNQDATNLRIHLQNKLAELQAYWQQVATINAINIGALASISIPGFGGPKGSPIGFAEGGVGFFSSPTTIQVAEARPEIVVAVPIGPSTTGGNLNASVSGQVDGIMPGFEGRFSAMMTEAALGAMSELLPS